MFGKKEEPQKQSVTVDSEKLSMKEDKPVEEVQEQKQELTIQDILINFEQRLQMIEAALFRLKGAI